MNPNVLAALLSCLVLSACTTVNGPATVSPGSSKQSPELHLETAPYEQKTQQPSVISDTDEHNKLSTAPYESNTEQPSVVAYQADSDPLLWWNKPVFYFNDKAYRYILSPVGKGYQKIVPNPVAKGVDRFFDNLSEPVNFINHVLQGKLSAAGKNLGRLTINSTIGLLGLFDVSESAFNLSQADTDFNITLRRWGVGHGPYLVIPLLGPADLRSGSSKIFDRYAHPITYIEHDQTRWAANATDGFITRIDLLAAYPDLVKNMEDPYQYFKALYIQNRERDEAFE